jgi:cytidylate kinase
MKREYDFSKAERGKFYRKGARLRLPIYLDARVQSQLERIARSKGGDIGALVNQLVKKEVRSIRNSR